LTALRFSLPDYTVGTGFQPVLLALAGLSAFSRFTAGGDFHPAPKLPPFIISSLPLAVNLFHRVIIQRSRV
jgi:hypothetical protein